MSDKLVSVVGATGAQGGSVISALRKDGTFSIRAITRNPNSDAAKALSSQGVEVVKADVNDYDSLVAAFSGSYAVYAVTDFFEPFGKLGPKGAVEIEVQQGVNLVKAAAATSTLEHYIWSTLPNGKKITNGKFVVPHFEAKNQIDDYIRSDAALLSKTTFLWVTFYAQNFYFPMFTPIHVPTAEKYIQVQNTPPSVSILSIGDARANVGVFVKAILTQPEKTLPAKFVLACVEETTAGDMLQTWAKAQGKTAQYVQIDDKAYFDIWPMWAEEIGLMMQFWDAEGGNSWSGEAEILTKEDLNINERLVGIEEAFTTLKF
ncbi:NAD(P)-binding protein [Glonium stellatum]|uniref:NAD(P)-binding protein n=1 Tax=Glonium stellatum TaxID=574774 RepID=A0A8E2JW29_9PEZI|nr:NAD(P)-binding protein [Glonium stellatum]